MNKLVLIFSILLLSALAQSADAQTSQVQNTLHDFTSDGCSWSPDGTVVLQKTEFVPCCVEHDVAYWAGGTHEQQQAADQRLKQCVKEKSNGFFANLYYGGVRMGGNAFLPTPFHWGYGWEKRRGYKPLSEEQQKMVQEKYSHVNWVQIYTSLGIELVK